MELIDETIQRILDSDLCQNSMTQNRIAEGILAECLAPLVEGLTKLREACDEAAKLRRLHDAAETAAIKRAVEAESALAAAQYDAQKFVDKLWLAVIAEDDARQQSKEAEAEIERLRAKLDMKETELERARAGNTATWCADAAISMSESALENERLRKAAKDVQKEASRLTSQRNRAWHTLSKIDDALGTCDESGLAFILAGKITLEDVAEYNAVIDCGESEDDDA